MPRKEKFEKYNLKTKTTTIRIPELEDLSKEKELRKAIDVFVIDFLNKELKTNLRLEQRILTEYINTRKLDDFLGILEEKGIDMVIDIRWNTLNKSKEGFNPENLRQFLEKNGIEYKYIHKLGNPSEFRKETKDPFKRKELYDNYIKDLEELQYLIKMVNSNNKIYCFICYCNTLCENECHRFWLREYILDYTKNNKKQK